jgi:pimeloyl-ACP methyl ester carboxylesterase
VVGERAEHEQEHGSGRDHDPAIPVHLRVCSTILAFGEPGGRFFATAVYCSALMTATLDPRDEITISLGSYGPIGPERWLAVDWREHLHSAMVAGRTVNYVDYGDRGNPIVVLVHGLAGRWQNWLSNIIGLSERFRVIALDLPGFGASELPSDAVSIPGFADAVAGLLDHLNAESAFLVGNSMGGMTSLQLALDHPARVRALVLVSPAGWSTNHMPEQLAQVADLGTLAGGALLAGRETVVRRPKLRARILHGVVAHPEALSSEICWELLGGAGTAGFAPALRALMAHDFRDRLGEIDQPALFIWGRRDGVVSSRDIVHFGERMPHAERIALADTGHVAMVEHPEWFDDTVTRFFLG